MKAAQATDAELLDAIREGDQRAGEVLFSRYAQLSRALCRKFGGGGDTPDIVQEVWTQVWRNPPVLRSGKFVGWLSVTMRRRVAEHQRRCARIAPMGSSSVIGDATSPTQHYALRQGLRQVWRALEAGVLSDQEVAALALKYSDEPVSSSEAASLLGVPASTVRDRATRAIRKLARRLGEPVEQTTGRVRLVRKVATRAGSQPCGVRDPSPSSST